MSNIPFTAISAALTPVQRETHEAIRARKLQALKNLHHAEDIQELDDTGVDAIHDDSRGRDNAGQGKREGTDQGGSRGEDTVDIQLLPSQGTPAAKVHPAAPIPHLDISA